MSATYTCLTIPVSDFDRTAEMLRVTVNWSENRNPSNPVTTYYLYLLSYEETEESRYTDTGLPIGHFRAKYDNSKSTVTLLCDSWLGTNCPTTATIECIHLNEALKNSIQTIHQSTVFNFDIKLGESMNVATLTITPEALTAAWKAGKRIQASFYNYLGELVWVDECLIRFDALTGLCIPQFATQGTDNVWVINIAGSDPYFYTIQLKDFYNEEIIN